MGERSETPRCILETERLLFRQHELADLEGFCEMEMDSEVRRYVGGYPRSREDAKRKFRESPLQQVSDRLGIWATVFKSTGRYIGRCGLYPHLTSDGETVLGDATLSFYIKREYWGQGFATEAAIAFVEFGWKHLGLTRIVATVQVGNDASVHILRKVGFELIATEHGLHRSFFRFALRNPNSQARLDSSR